MLKLKSFNVLLKWQNQKSALNQSQAFAPKPKLVWKLSAVHNQVGTEIASKRLETESILTE